MLNCWETDGWKYRWALLLHYHPFVYAIWLFKTTRYFKSVM